MVVDYAGSGEIDGLVFFMHSPGEVDVFRIHEEPFVEQSDFPKCTHPQQHEASMMIRRIDWIAQIIVSQFIVVKPLTGDSSGKEAM